MQEAFELWSQYEDNQLWSVLPQVPILTSDCVKQVSLPTFVSSRLISSPGFTALWTRVSLLGLGSWFLDFAFSQNTASRLATSRPYSPL